MSENPGMPRGEAAAEAAQVPPALPASPTGPAQSGGQPQQPVFRQPGVSGAADAAYPARQAAAVPESGGYDVSGYPGPARWPGAGAPPQGPRSTERMAASAREAGAAMKAMGAAAWQKAGETWQASNDPSRQSDSFAARIFDMSFTRYVTPSVAKLFYILSLVAVWLAWIGSVVTAFGASRYMYGGGGYVLLVVVLGFLVALAATIGIRMGIEGAVARVRTAEHAREIAEALRGQNGEC